MEVQDRRFHVEQSTAAPIPAEARHGAPRELFTFWLTTTTNFGAIIVGGIAISLGLGFWQSVLAIAAGAASFVLLGVVSTLGPRFGVPTMAIGERVFGRRANKVNAFAAWLLTLGWSAVGLVIGALSVQSIIAYYAPHASTVLTRIVGLAVMAVLLYVASLFGNTTLKSVEGWLGYVFAVIVVTVCVTLALHGSFDQLRLGRGAVPLVGHSAWVAFSLAAVVLISSGGLSWSYMGADYARYLPADVRPARVGVAATLGGAIPALLIPVLGVVLVISGHFSDPITDIPRIVPGWIGVPFLAFAVISTAAGYVPNLYSAGLNLLVLGAPIRRGASVAVVFAISLAAAVYALFVSDFISSFETFLSLAVVWITPWLTVLLLAVFLHAYEHDGTARMPVSWRACTAGIVGVLVALLCANDAPLWVGPVATALHGGDISIYASAIATAGVFLALRARKAPVASSPAAAGERGRADA